MRASTKKKTILSICLALTLVLSTIAFAAVSYAWFAGYWNNPSTSIKPGSNADLPPIEMWTYISDSDLVTNPEYEAQKNTWIVNTAAKPDGEHGYMLPGAPYDATTTNGVTSYSFQNPQLHFGRVDNLITLQPDNLVYLRLTVNTGASGANHLHVKLDYVNEAPTVQQLYDSITLYGVDPDVSTSQITLISDSKLKQLISFPASDGTSGAGNYDKTADVSSEYCQFMQISACATSDPEALPGTEKFALLESKFGEFDMIGGDPIMLDLHENIFAYTDTTPDDDALGTYAPATSTPETYYVYIKIAPKLEFFVLQENLLDQFVPSYMFFDTKLEIELH